MDIEDPIPASPKTEPIPTDWLDVAQCNWSEGNALNAVACALISIATDLNYVRQFLANYNVAPGPRRSLAEAVRDLGN